MSNSDDSVFEPLHAVPARDRVLQQIRRSINLGRFRPGESLPPAPDLARMLGVSRTTLLEAISMLADEGVIEVKRGRGGGLRVTQSGASSTELRNELQRNRKSIRDIFEHRIALESMAAKLAAERRTKTDLSQLRLLMKRIDALLERQHDSPVFADFHDLDTRFHLAIARASRNERLVSGISETRAEMFLPVGAVFADLEPSANDLHALIVDAIEAKDADEASRLMSAHIEGTCRSVERWLKSRR